jgi:hypothetical protein
MELMNKYVYRYTYMYINRFTTTKKQHTNKKTKPKNNSIPKKCGYTYQANSKQGRYYKQIKTGQQQITTDSIRQRVAVLLLLLFHFASVGIYTGPSRSILRINCRSFFLPVIAVGAAA